MTQARATRRTEVVTHHGEGPAWDAAHGVLRFVDVTRGDVLTLDGEQVTRRHVSEIAAAWRPRAAGGMVVGVARGFALVDEGGAVRELPPLWTDPTMRMNDGGCDPQGRFYCGSMTAGGATPGGALYRLDPDLGTTIVLTGVAVSNGLVWSSDGRTAYYIDSATQRVDALDFDDTSGSFSGRRRFVEVDADLGAPDGMAIDTEGGLWVAIWGGGVVHRYDAGGALSEVIEVGARQVSACAFGGADLDDLYITTSRQDLGPDDDPEAGALFHIRPGVSGRETVPFRA